MSELEANVFKLKAYIRNLDTQIRDFKKKRQCAHEQLFQVQRKQFNKCKHTGHTWESVRWCGEREFTCKHCKFGPEGPLRPSI